MENERNHTLANGIECYSIDGISQLVQGMGQPKFRAKQLVQWIYHHQITSYDQMGNIPKQLRQNLAEHAPLHIPEVIDKQVSKDGSRKYVLSFHDGTQVETVGIPSAEKDNEGNPKRLTVCFSTQVGCPMACAFCATGKEGLTRNLYAGEMAQQVLTVQRDFQMKATNIVAMGQGEPFLNYDHVIEALHIMNHSDAIGIGARHITVSTCGILDGIRRFGNEPEQFTLAVSLHAARQSVRDELMPKCKAMPLDSLKQALISYYECARRRVTFEYLMIDNVNDSDDDLQALMDFCDDLHAHVNLIPLNNVAGSKWVLSSENVMRRWISLLEDNGVSATIRRSKGSDIDGACGQLKNKIAT